MLKILGTTNNGINVYKHATASHSHRPDLDAEVINKLTITEGQTFLRETVELGRVIGEDHLVETDENDLIAFARRDNRMGETRFVLNRAAKPTTLVTVIACVDRDPGETQGKWCLFTLFEGEPGCREPWDDSLKTEEAKAEAKTFWDCHALVPTEEERKMFICNAEYTFFDKYCEDANSFSETFNNKEDAIKWLNKAKETLGEDFAYGAVYDKDDNEVFSL